MRQIVFFLLACAGFLGLLNHSAEALTHIDLNVRLDQKNRLLYVQGTSSAPVHLPGKSDKHTSFDYQLKLPETSDWNGGAYIGERGLYLPGNWAPQSDGLITFNMVVDSPLVTVAPGAILEEQKKDNAYHARFVMDQPTEGIPLFAGPYKIFQMNYKSTLLRTYFYEGMEELAQGYLERTAQYLQQFEKMIGPYPFAGFHIVAAPVPTGYGFAGLTYIGERVLHLPFIKESSLGHEIMHNYWGNGVFPDYTTGNWAEGLTTYMADYMTAEQTSPVKARDMRLSWLRDFAALPAEQDKPVRTFKGKHSQASQVIGYHKAAFIFHMLRETLGDAAFFDGLQTFWKTHAFQQAGWGDLKDAFSQASGNDLSTFFKQWVEGTGAPSFTSLAAKASYDKALGWKIDVQVIQNQPPFQTILPLGMGTGDTVTSHTIDVKGVMSRDTIQTSTRPFALSLDPDFNIFRQLGPNEVAPILRDVMLSSRLQIVCVTPSMKDNAMALTQRLSDAEVTAKSQNLPFVLVGQHNDVMNEMSKRHLPASRLPVDDDTTAQVWAGKTETGIPYMVISVQDVEALQDLMRPLPHYGSRHGLLFKGSKAVYKTTGQSRPMSVPVN